MYTCALTRNGGFPLFALLTTSRTPLATVTLLWLDINPSLTIINYTIKTNNISVSFVQTSGYPRVVLSTCGAARVPVASFTVGGVVANKIGTIRWNLVKGNHWPRPVPIQTALSPRVVFSTFCTTLFVPVVCRTILWIKSYVSFTCCRNIVERYNNPTVLSIQTRFCRKLKQKNNLSTNFIKRKDSYMANANILMVKGQGQYIFLLRKWMSYFP